MTDKEVERFEVAQQIRDLMNPPKHRVVGHQHMKKFNQLMEQLRELEAAMEVKR